MPSTTIEMKCLTDKTNLTKCVKSYQILSFGYLKIFFEAGLTRDFKQKNVSVSFLANIDKRKWECVC